MSGIVIKEGNSDPDTFREGRWWENGNVTIEAETGMMLLYVKSTKDCQDCPGQEWSHPESQKECGPANTSLQTTSLQTHLTIHFYTFKPPSMWCLVIAALAYKYRDIWGLQKNWSESRELCMFPNTHVPPHTELSLLSTSCIRVWYICYNWWANIDALLLTKVHRLCLLILFM